jgi:hypothetical protein
MLRISARLATWLLAFATAGCGTVTASQPAAATHTAVPATAPNAGQTPVPAASPASTATASGCQSPAPGGPGVKTLVITLAGNDRTYCVRVGDKLSVYLRGTAAHPWQRPLASSNALMPIPDPALTLARGVTAASFAAARPGQVLVTSVRLPCRISTPPGKGGIEPAFPVPAVHPLPWCGPTHRFSASVIVLR